MQKLFPTPILRRDAIQKSPQFDFGLGGTRRNCHFREVCLKTTGCSFGDRFGCFFLEILVEHQNLVEFLVGKILMGKSWWENICLEILTQKYFH